MERVVVFAFNIKDWRLAYSRISNQESIPGQITAHTEIILNGVEATVEEIQNIITSARAEVFLEADGENIIRLEITTR